MAAEGGPDGLGPRYAPSDPTLPEPWKGLVDGSSGVLYYWNPETNVTQYEKPGASIPPLPAGLPPVASAAPKLAPIPNGQPAHQITSNMQQPQQPGPQSQQHIEQNNPQMSQGVVPGLQQHIRPQMGPSQHTFSTLEQQMPTQQGVPMPQTYQGGPPGQQQGYQNTHQPMHYMGYPQQNIPQQQDQKAAFLQRGDAEFQQGKQAGFPPSQIHQSGVQPLEGNSGVQLGQTTPYTGSQFSVPPSYGHLDHGGISHQQHAPRFQDQTGTHVPPVGFNANNDGPHQPRLAVIPMARNPPDMRFGTQNVLPGGPSGPSPMPGPAPHNIYGHATGGPPYPNNTMMTPNPETMNLSSVDAYLQKHDVTATGDNVPAPFMSFESTGFPPEILREIHAAGFASPTPIQAQTWPIALQNRDIVAVAKTGSGKTLGYLIPAFMLLRFCRNNPQNGPTVVVLAPTRELATQIQEEAIKFGRSARVSCTCLYGGAPKGPQLKELERGADIVVATPGRLNDILEMKRIDFRQVSLLVLDEADRMLDMGFEPQIRKIVNEIPSRRQTLMYTATWPKEVRKIAGDLLVNPVQVNIGNVDELAANKSITQYVEVVPYMEKQRRLEQILRSEERGSKIIIFCSTKKLCDQLTRSISRNFGAAAIHGDKSQGERDWVLNQFRSGKSPILVATDVAARGLDVKDVRVVINYDFPTGVEDYVHRIGRTGRAGAKGIAYTFFSEQDWKYAADLIKVLEGANQPVPPEVRDIAARGGPGFGKERGGMNRFDSAGRGGGRDGGFGGRGGDSRNGFGGRGGGGDFRDGRSGGRDDMRGGGFGGRGGGRSANDGFGNRGGFGGRGGGMRDGGNYGGRGGMRDGGGYGGRGGFGGREDRFMDSRGRGGGRGRGRLDNRRDGDRGRGRSYSRSPERVRTWGRSRSRSRDGDRTRGRSRSWSRSYSRSRSRSWSRSRSRSRSRSPVKRERRRESKFDQVQADVPAAAVPQLAKPEAEVLPGDEQQNMGVPGPTPGVE